ncbi:DUF1385 domain-containing protein [Kamptonema cortianum]|nr:DUF1385 domain-containing protein [Geitlerinema splendidum]MDK3155349.1 DUF1385 domain-containing protein [Kamptonema cortianum]
MSGNYRYEVPIWGRPIGTALAPVESVHSFNSLEVAASMMIDYGLAALPVVQDGIYVGMISESAISNALANGADPQDATVGFVERIPALRGYATGAEALRLLTEFSCDALAVTDDAGHVIGVITPSRLLARTDRQVRPRLVGGMATPLGVYLNAGGITGGVKGWGLFLAGASLFLTIIAASTIVNLLVYQFQTTLATVPHIHLLIEFSTLLLFFFLLKLQPLAGYHAAEHMVVHAIEQGEELTMETVKRMPRVHPRCGTNLAVGLMIFLGIQSTTLIAETEVRTLLGLLAVLFLYKPVGNFVQAAFTTRRPNEKQILAGIDAGNKLLENYRTARRSQVSIPTRILRSGLLHVMAGSMAMALVTYGLMDLLQVPDAFRVL